MGGDALGGFTWLPKAEPGAPSATQAIARAGGVPALLKVGLLSGCVAPPHPGHTLPACLVTS